MPVKESIMAVKPRHVIEETLEDGSYNVESVHDSFAKASAHFSTLDHINHHYEFWPHGWVDTDWGYQPYDQSDNNIGQILD